MNNEDTHGPVPEDARYRPGSPGPKRKQAFENVTRQLSDDDLTNPAVLKLLLEERDILANENAELRNYQARFHEADKKVAVLQEKNKTHLVAEILSGVCFTIGAAMIGYAPILWKSQPSGWIALAFGLVLIIGGIFAKAVKR